MQILIQFSLVLEKVCVIMFFWNFYFQLPGKQSKKVTVLKPIFRQGVCIIQVMPIGKLEITQMKRRILNTSEGLINIFLAMPMEDVREANQGHGQGGKTSRCILKTGTNTEILIRRISKSSNEYSANSYSNQATSYKLSSQIADLN